MSQRKTGRRKIVAIIGPTASGKSALAVALAKKLRGEVISADSRQVYRGLDIGSAKITKKEMRGISHYCLDCASPKERYTVEDFRHCVKEAIHEIRKKNKIPILVGGSGFYIDAILFDTKFPEVPPNYKLRRALEKKPADALFKELQKLDPKRARAIGPANKRRIIRAIEIVKTTGKPIPDAKRKTKLDTYIIGIVPNKQTLQKNVARRTTAMLRRGLLHEVRRIKKSLPEGRIQEFGFEYYYPLLYVKGAISKDEMIRKINTETWRYAKRQMTWFRRNKSIRWVRSPAEAERLTKNFGK